MVDIATRIIGVLLGEARINVDPVEVEAIMKIVQDGGRDIGQMNAQLASYDTVIEYDPEIDAAGACGGYNGDRLFLNPKMLWYLRQNPEYFNTVLNHELVHRGQMDRVAKAGKDPKEIVNRVSSRYNPKTGQPIDLNSYTEEPIEAMALAKNAVDSARSKKVDVHKALRQGTLGSHSPVPVKPGNKRFGKYAYQYANQQ